MHKIHITQYPGVLSETILLQRDFLMNNVSGDIEEPSLGTMSVRVNEYSMSRPHKVVIRDRQPVTPLSLMVILVGSKTEQ